MSSLRGASCDGATVPSLPTRGGARLPFERIQQMELLEIFIPVTL